MTFSAAQSRLQQAVFDRLGEDAQWEGVAAPVRVRWREHDETHGFGQAVEQLTVRFLWVRRSEVPAAEEGQFVQILDAAGAPVPEGRLRVIGEPRCDRKGVWKCEVTPAPAPAE